MNNTPICITIAGSDPCAGAGIQADLKTFASLNCYGMSVLTCSTVQTHHGLTQFLPLPAEHVAQQLASLLEVYEVGAIKTGMLCDASIIRGISDVLAQHSSIPLIVDPVLSASQGSEWSNEQLLEAYKADLLQRSSLLTPNYPEALKLFDAGSESLQQISDQYMTAIYLKGGHDESTGDTVVDTLFVPKTEVIRYQHPRITTTNDHGTGCSLSAAVTSYLAQGLSLKDSVTAANHYLQRILNNSKGFLHQKASEPLHNLPMNHFC